MENNYTIPDVNLRFYELLKKTDMTQKEFGVLLGVSQSQISAICQGQSRITDMLIELIKSKLNVSEEWLREGKLPIFREKPKEKNTNIPLIGKVPAGNWHYWIDSYVQDSSDSVINIPGIDGENLFAIRVDGDSMEPQLYDGDILIINPEKEWSNGIALISHNVLLQVRIVRKIEGRKYLLIPCNPKYESEEIARDETTQLYVPVKIISMKDI